MISLSLKRIFLFSIPIFIIHGLEEYFTGFYHTDSIARFILQPFEQMSTYQASFLVLQIMIWLLLIISFLLISDTKWHLRLMVIPGLVYFFEFHHIIKALVKFGYYPGVISGLLFPIIAFLFWREFLKHFRTA